MSTPRPVMAVTFERHGHLHYLHPAVGQHPQVGDKVLYPTDQGPEVAEVVWAPEFTTVEVELPTCAGPATAADLRRDADRRQQRADALLLSRRLVREHGLGMKVLAVDVTEEEVAVYYSAPERVDFRALVPELARGLQARIDLRQIGAREAASVVGGIGPCGRDLCCATFLRKLEPVSLRLAREQVPDVNPLNIQGACGKLMCCLRYEDSTCSLADTCTTAQLRRDREAEQREP